MKKFLPIYLILLFASFDAAAKLCAKTLIEDPLMAIKMDDEWYKKEEARIGLEDALLQKYSQYITKETRPLSVEYYKCLKGEACDSLNNCQMHKDAKKYHEIEYKIKTDVGITIAKSYCSEIGKCIGYNDFLHSKKVTAAEDRLIDVKKDNAIFYHYFYSAHSKSYEPPFNITNFHTGSELHLNDFPHFSPDEKVLLEIRSIPKGEDGGDFPTGYKINIYEINQYGEYKNIEPDEVDKSDSKKVISTFLSRNLNCGETPHFYSWKSNREAVLSALPSNQENGGKKVILFYNKENKKWGCKEENFVKFKCQSYLPSSAGFVSNLSKSQIEECYK